MIKENIEMTSVLIVEDDEVAIFLAQETLSDMGFRDIRIAMDGIIACECLNQSCPDLVLLDLNLPIMDGFEFLEENKIKSYCPDINVVILTSSLRPADKAKAGEFPNIVDYIEKPITIDKVEQALNKI